MCRRPSTSRRSTRIFGSTEWNLQVATKNISLDPDKRLVIGVNSFGFGGANAHVILQSAELWQPEKQSAPRIQAPLLLSARSPEALKRVRRPMRRGCGSGLICRFMIWRSAPRFIAITITQGDRVRRGS